jgi:hypothetical protein
MSAPRSSSRACEVRHIIFSLPVAPSLSKRQLKKWAHEWTKITRLRLWIVVERHEHGLLHLDFYLKKQP